MKSWKRLFLFFSLAAGALVAEGENVSSVQVGQRAMTGGNQLGRVFSDELLAENRKLSEYATAALPKFLEAFPKWNFDIDMEEHDRKVRERLVEDEKEGWLLKNDDYDANPCRENLLPLNPTVRFLNQEAEAFAVSHLDGAGYTRCDDLMRTRLGDDDEDVEVQGWQIEGNVYMALTCDTSGAMRIRQYRFYRMDGDNMAEIASFDSLPSVETARVIRGVVMGMPEAQNNMAVLLQQRTARLTVSDEDDMAARLLELSAKRGCPEAIWNLYRVYVGMNEMDKAIEHLKRHGARCFKSAFPSLEAVDVKALQVQMKDRWGAYAADSLQRQRYLALYASRGVGMAYSQLGMQMCSEKKLEEGARLFERGAALGDVMSKRQLATMKFDGTGTRQDSQGAERLLLELIEAGDLVSCYMLGNRYFHGNGLPRDLEKGWRYMQQACKPLPPEYPDGCASARFAVACILKQKKNRSAEETQMMFQYFMALADKGHPRAIAFYGRLLIDAGKYDEARRYLGGANNTTAEGREQLQRLKGLTGK